MTAAGNDDEGHAPAPVELASAQGLPQAYVPFVTETLVTAAIKFGFDVLGTGVEAGIGAGISRLKGINPLPYKIAASWHDPKTARYCCAVEFLNLTGHGTYLEDMFVSSPKNIAFSVNSKNPRGMMYTEEPVLTRMDLPFYIPAGLQEPKPLIVALEDDRDGTLSKAETVTLDCRFSIVGGPKSKKLRNEQIFLRIRKGGPNY